MRELIVDDTTAWEKLPGSRWMLNKLYVHQSMGCKCGPIGIDPPEYPVWVKPTINVYGFGINSRLVESSDSIKFEPGMMWMPYYTGDHVSYDIKYEHDEITIVYSAKGINGPYFTEWQVDQIEPSQQLKFLVYKLSCVGKLPTYFNVETIGNNLIECHPRWSEEFIDYYYRCPFKQKVIWSENINTLLPNSWIDCRNDSSNLFTGQFKRIGFTYEFE